MNIAANWAIGSILIFAVVFSIMGISARKHLSLSLRYLLLLSAAAFILAFLTLSVHLSCIHLMSMHGAIEGAEYHKRYYDASITAYRAFAVSLLCLVAHSAIVPLLSFVVHKITCNQQR